MAIKKTSKSEARLKLIQTLRDCLLEFAIEAEGEDNLTRQEIIEMRENLLEVADVLFEDMKLEVVSVDADGTVNCTMFPDYETF